jgi:acyl carrier protein
MNEVQEKGLAIVAQLSGKNRAELEPKHHLIVDLGIDSPKALQLLLMLEEQLGIEISDDDAAKMDTLGDVLDYLGARV